MNNFEEVRAGRLSRSLLLLLLVLEKLPKPRVELQAVDSFFLGSIHAAHLFNAFAMGSKADVEGLLFRRLICMRTSSIRGAVIGVERTVRTFLKASTAVRRVYRHELEREPTAGTLRNSLAM